MMCQSCTKGSLWYYHICTFLQLINKYMLCISKCAIMFEAVCSTKSKTKSRKKNNLTEIQLYIHCLINFFLSCGIFFILWNFSCLKILLSYGIFRIFVLFKNYYLTQPPPPNLVKSYKICNQDQF